MGIRHHKNPSNIMSVATDRRILSLLVRARMSLRRQRRDTSFYHRLAQTGRNPRTSTEADLSALLPPRREWPRPGLRARRIAAERGLDAVSIVLVDWLLSNISKPNRESPDWLRRLRRFVGSVRARIRDWGRDASFEMPKIYAAIKNRALESGQADSFRCLAMYSLPDRMVISIAARYLREVFDSVMHPGSLAFRTQFPTLTHHDAVERIIRFREDHCRRPLWVAEVDIRGFFDVVEHKVARDAVSALRATLPDGRCLDARALSILDAYFESYSFNKFGRREAEQYARKRKRCGHGVEVPWPSADLCKLEVDTDTDLVGIPQGGALSCFLANAILDQADRAVQRAVSSTSAADQEAVYLRYCDDIICLATSRATCERMVGAYRGALRKLKLPAHPMLKFNRLYEGRRECQPGGCPPSEPQRRHRPLEGQEQGPIRVGASRHAGSCSVVRVRRVSGPI